MGIEEFEKNLEKKIELERDAERQRMLRELKNIKVKTKKDESIVVLADEIQVNKRNQKVWEKQGAKKKTQSDEEDLMRKWRSAPNNNNLDIKSMLEKRQKEPMYE